MGFDFHDTSEKRKRRGLEQDEESYCLGNGTLVVLGRLGREGALGLRDRMCLYIWELWNN